jgi:siroheme synthase
LQAGDDPDWSVLARPGQTLALYMSLQRLRHTTRSLVRHGLPPSTPVALVSEGTTQRQRVVRGTAATIAGLATGVPSPALLFVGEAVAMADKLHWFGGDNGLAVVPDRQAAEIRRTALSA